MVVVHFQIASFELLNNLPQHNITVCLLKTLNQFKSALKTQCLVFDYGTSLLGLYINVFVSVFVIQIFTHCGKAVTYNWIVLCLFSERLGNFN